MAKQRKKKYKGMPGVAPHPRQVAVMLRSGFSQHEQAQKAAITLRYYFDAQIFVTSHKVTNGVLWRLRVDHPGNLPEYTPPEPSPKDHKCDKMTEAERAVDRWKWSRGCFGKAKYPTRGAAERAKYGAKKHRGVSLQIYRCGYCRQYHLTSKKEQY